MKHDKDLLSIIFSIEKRYKHCICCGRIYDKDWSEELYRLTPPTPIEYDYFGKYNISSGICPNKDCLCYVREINRRGKQ